MGCFSSLSLFAVAIALAGCGPGGPKVKAGPQFTKVEYGPIWQQILGLGLIFTFTGTLITMAYGIVAGFLGMRLSKHMGVLNRISAVIFAVTMTQERGSSVPA